MGLEITTADVEGIPVATLAGELDIYTVPHFQQTLEASFQESRRIAVDFRQVSLVDSSGLGALLRIAQVDGSRWRPVVLICEGPSMPRLLELTKLEDRFILVTDVSEMADALEAAAQESPERSNGGGAATG